MVSDGVSIFERKVWSECKNGEGEWGEMLKKYDCPPCIYQIRSKLPVFPATGNSNWSNPDAIRHQMSITPHQKDIAAVTVSQERQKFSRDFRSTEYFRITGN